ncbi:MAG TPA: TIGR01777 family oxidoreductase [Cytophaga sp.]|jgi:uncharacterized protein (TIGR01777 family)|nr:TIGR01777 family oxidoreductase [Cytophaga sp.]
MKKKIVIAGGTGFIGKYLNAYFTSQGYAVKIISRQPNTILWTDTDAIIGALEGSEMLLNLAGKSVDCRYNEINKAEILSSRIDTTNILGTCILQCKTAPKLWLNSSTATIYRHAEDRPMTESTGEIGTGFSVGIATQWEKAFFSFTLPETRQVALRMSIVLGDDGGVMRPLRNLVRFGLGGKQGSGNQRFSWIHIEDLKNIVLFIQAHTDMSGVYNCAAPEPVTNKIFMKLLRKEMKMPFGLPTPKWLLKIGAVLIRTETELILKSRWVLPERLQKDGFNFTYPQLDEALKNILR